MSSPPSPVRSRPLAAAWGRLWRVPFTLRAAATVWVIVVTALFGRVTFAPKFPPSVTPVYQAAALRWQAGQDLYAPYQFADHWDVFRYPPGFAAAFTPFTWLPLRLAELLWRGGTLAVLVSGLWCFARRGLGLNPAQTGGFYLLVLLLGLTSLGNAQANVLLLGLILHAVVAAVRLRGPVAGLLLALAAAVKVYPVAVGLLLSCVRPRRILPWLAVALVAFAAAPFAVAPAGYLDGQYRSFVRSVTADDRRVDAHPHPPRDLYFVLKRYFVAPSDRTYTIIVLAVAAGMAAVVTATALRGRGPRPAVLLAFDLGCVWMTVFGPATEPSTYTVLAPTAAAAVLFARGSRAQFVLATVAYVLLISPVVRDFFPNGRPFHNLGAQPLGGLLLLFVLLWRWTGSGIFCASGRGGDMIMVCEPSAPSLSSTFRP